jgi:cellulose synthase/poly-beta-1,6-N-acetylglucosamine synthase-like glycosyltransferase
VTYEPRAISRTSVPEWTFQLLNQRYRWTRGNFQAALKAWRRWHEAPEAPRLLPVWLGTFLFETVAWPLLNLFGLLAFLVVVAVSGLHVSEVVWFLALTALDLNEAAFSVRVERGDLRLLPLAAVNRVYYNVLLDVNKLFALYDELRGRRMRWMA